MTLWHKTLEKRFSQFPREQQILMVANELNRAQNNLSDSREYRNCLERALELMDFMIVPDLELHFTKEFLRARDQIAAAYLSTPARTDQLQNMLFMLDSKVWRLLHEKNDD